MNLKTAKEKFILLYQHNVQNKITNFTRVDFDQRVPIDSQTSKFSMNVGIPDPVGLMDFNIGCFQKLDQFK